MESKGRNKYKRSLSDYEILYQLEKESSWKSYKQETKVATGNVTNIDKTDSSVPTITYLGGANSCTWKNNYNLNLNLSDSQSGVSYFEIDTNGEGHFDGTTGSNFNTSNG